MKVLKPGRSKGAPPAVVLPAWSAELVCVGGDALARSLGLDGTPGCGALLLVERCDLSVAWLQRVDKPALGLVHFVCPECGMYSFLWEKSIPEELRAALLAEQPQR